MRDKLWLRHFIAESNRIEGILREPNPDEFKATARFLDFHDLRVGDLSELVSVYQPDAVIRDQIGLTVRVGGHIAPEGGPWIVDRLKALLAKVSAVPDAWSPWMIHTEYETLHPFTDGNGRSGRALWLWHMLKIGGYHARQAKELGFLHTFYYQTLERSR